MGKKFGAGGKAEQTKEGKKWRMRARWRGGEGEMEGEGEGEWEGEREGKMEGGRALLTQTAETPYNARNT